MSLLKKVIEDCKTQLNEEMWAASSDEDKMKELQVMLEALQEKLDREDCHPIPKGLSTLTDDAILATLRCKGECNTCINKDCCTDNVDGFCEVVAQRLEKLTGKIINPLTIEEVATMIGEPVYLETLSKWCIIQSVVKTQIDGLWEIILSGCRDKGSLVLQWNTIKGITHKLYSRYYNPPKEGESSYDRSN